MLQLLFTLKLILKLKSMPNQVRFTYNPLFIINVAKCKSFSKYVENKLCPNNFSRSIFKLSLNKLLSKIKNYFLLRNFYDLTAFKFTCRFGRHVICLNHYFFQCSLFSLFFIKNNDRKLQNLSNLFYIYKINQISKNSRVD